MGYVRRPIEVKLLAGVDISEPEKCWIRAEPGALYAGTGYSSLRVDGKVCLAHRISWTLFNGEIPEGMSVLHNCPGPVNNKLCINPNHLYLGNETDNMLDAVKRGEYPVQFTDDQIRAMREEFNSRGKQSGRSLARKNGLESKFYWLIVNKKTYCWVQ